MSRGITPREFVKQVYYMQEKVLLDFWPTDDKYKEVLYEANLVLQELQNAEDWTWLREQIILGPCHDHPGSIPEFELPPWVYKPSTLYHDGVKLYRPLRWHHGCHECGECHEAGICLNQWDPLLVPIASSGDNQFRKERLMTPYGQIHLRDPKLRAVVEGNTVTFNRPLRPYEGWRVAVMDVQRRIKEAHICGPHCVGRNPKNPISYELDEHGEWVNPCRFIERRLFTEIPDPNYVVLATAARHAEGSPPAQARIQGLNDAALRVLSAMRQNDAAATDADYADWEIPGYFEVV